MDRIQGICAIKFNMNARLRWWLEGMAVGGDFDITRLHVDHAAKKRGQGIGIIGGLEDW